MGKGEMMSNIEIAFYAALTFILIFGIMVGFLANKVSELKDSLSLKERAHNIWIEYLEHKIRVREDMINELKPNSFSSPEKGKGPNEN